MSKIGDLKSSGSTNFSNLDEQVTFSVTIDTDKIIGEKNILILSCESKNIIRIANGFISCLN